MLEHHNTGSELDSLLADHGDHERLASSGREHHERVARFVVDKIPHSVVGFGLVIARNQESSLSEKKNNNFTRFAFKKEVFMLGDLVERTTSESNRVAGSFPDTRTETVRGGTFPEHDSGREFHHATQRSRIDFFHRYSPFSSLESKTRNASLII